MIEFKKFGWPLTQDKIQNNWEQHFYRFFGFKFNQMYYNNIIFPMQVS